MTREQIIGAKFCADKISDAARVLLTLVEIEDSAGDAPFLREYFRKEIARQLPALAAECGFTLVPAEEQRVAA